MSEAARIRAYTYTCEKCGEGVTLSHAQFIAQDHGKHGAKILCDECKTPKLTVVSAPTKKFTMRPRHLPPTTTKGLNLNPNERADYGVTITIREQTTRHLRTVTAHGMVKEATIQACDAIDTLDGNWKIITVSTPGSIYGDLQGSRNLDTLTTEISILGRAGRLDLLEDYEPKRERSRGKRKTAR